MKIVFKNIFFYLFFVFFISMCDKVSCAEGEEGGSGSGSSDVRGYRIAAEGKKGIAVQCNSKDNASVGDQAICEKYSTASNSACEAIESTLTFENPIFMCNPSGDSYCLKDTDCKVLGKNACVVSPGSSQKFESQISDDDFETTMSEAGVVGICVSLGGSGEDNAFGQAICNLMNVVTGNAGRAVVGVVVIVVGIMFFLGKVTWSLVLAVALGAGAIFGAPKIVKVVTGKEFVCR